MMVLLGVGPGEQSLPPGDRLQLSGRDLGGIELSAKVAKPQAYSLSCSRTVAEAVTVLMPVKDDDPPFRTTISVTVFGIPLSPAVTVT